MPQRRSRKPTLHDRLDHLFGLSWKRHEKIKRALEHIHELLHVINERTIQMAGEVDRIETEVTEMSGVIDSATATLEKFAALIRDNATNPARLTKIADDLDAKANALAEAIKANDPDTPPPVEEPPVEPVP